jgi:tetratricopeptide (TPR) repeat protein
MNKKNLSPLTPPLPQVIARHRTRILSAGLFLLVVIAYIPTCWAGYIWDDSDHVFANQTLRSVSGLWRMWTVPTSLPQWYPLVHTTFWLEYHLWGANPVGYHIDNVLLHAGATVLLWILLCRLNVRGAWLAAAIFGVHPVHVESVAWISERKNTLSTFFYLCAALSYLKWDGDLLGSAASGEQLAAREGKWKWYSITLLLYAAALFSKTVACSFPAAIVLAHWWKRGRVSVRTVLGLVPMFTIGLILALTTAWLERAHVKAVGASWKFASTPVGELVARTLIAGRALWFYASKLLVPWPLAFMYSRWHIHVRAAWQYVFPIAALGAVLALHRLRHRMGRGPLFGVMFFMITLVPALGFFNIYPMRFSFVADHFQHLASVGLTTLLAVGLARLAGRYPRTGAAMCAGLLLALASLTAAQCTIYYDAQTLWQDTVNKTPDSWMVYTNLGHAMESDNRPLDAIPYHETALRLAPDIPDTHENVAVARMLQHRYEDAEREFHLALAIDPNFVPAITDLGKLEYFYHHDAMAAEALYQRALSFSPADAPANYAYAVLLEQRGDLEAALAHYRAAAAVSPDDFDTEYDQGSVLLKLKRPTEAIEPLRWATQLQPRSGRAWINLRAAYTMAGQPDQAAACAREALEAMSQGAGGANP